MSFSGCALCSVLTREKVEELCCLYALGELAPEQTRRIRGHVRECKACCALVEEFERIMLFDLPSIEVLHSEGSEPADPESVDATKLLEKVWERARSGPEEEEGQPGWGQSASSALAGTGRSRLWHAARMITLAAGWLIAAMLLFDHEPLRSTRSTAARGDAPKATQAELDSAARAATVARQLQAANAIVKELQVELARSSERSRIVQTQIARLNLEYQDLSGVNTDLRTRVRQQEDLLAQTSAQLQLTRDSLNSEMAAKAALEGQLSDVYGRLEKQRQEAANLAHVAATVPAAYPVAETREREGEAGEILGARDLHIVDVYDVDDSGAAAHAYGRIYYVNHSLLIFYAFDLSKLERNHKLVAFQAWGFRQPRSSKVESLGLFYLDNATLSRWALRITNPEILSRIDTLFVTVEPPGGSRFPKGRRLLMASLAGPPNHP
jgi:hypothetical protein